MAIKIGGSVRAAALDTAGKAFLSAGVIALGYGAMTTLGLTAEMVSKLEMAQLIYDLSSPVVDAGAAMFSHAAQVLGAQPIQGDLMPNAPTGIKVGTSGAFMAGLGAGAVLIGAKLKEAGHNMVDRTASNPLERLMNLKASIRAGALLNQGLQGQEEAPEAPRM